MILEVPLPSRPSIAAALVAARPDVRPAVANALWAPLRQRRWVRALIPTVPWAGQVPPVITTTPPVPTPEPRWEPVDELECLYAFAPRARTRIGLGFSVKLLRRDHDRVLEDTEPLARLEFERALAEAVAERPFYRAAELPNGWRRNHRDPLITERVERVLDHLALVAHVEIVPPNVEDALLS